MALTLSQKLAQIAIPLIATLALSSCASDGFIEDIGKPLPPAGEVKRLPPYDPFGSGDSEDADDESDGEQSAGGLGARPTQPASEPDSEGQNTVAKTQMAAITPLETPSSSPSPVDGSAGLSPFAGLSAEELRAQWGAPSLTRTEAGAQLWQFKGKGCVVLAYLYPNSGGGMETAYAEAHPGGGDAQAVTACLGKSARPREAARTRKPELIVKPD
jgi:hypothetical protein